MLRFRRTISSQERSAYKHVVLLSRSFVGSAGGGGGNGYQSMGSFHSENLGDLMRRSNVEYQPPTLPFTDETDTSNQHLSVPRTRRDANSYREDFAVDFDHWTFLNHGAFGAALRVGSDRAAAWRRYAEQQPLRYFDRELLPHLAYSTRCLADVLKAPDRTNVTLLPNVTAGLNAVLSGHTRVYGNDAYCILWDVSYGSVKKMAQHYYGANRVVEIPFQPKYLTRLAQVATNHPTIEGHQETQRTTTEHVFLEALDDCLDQHEHILKDKHICLVLDHTTSNTALTFPIASLASHIKYRCPNVTVVVDGAHGLLAQDCNLTQLFGTSGGTNHHGVDVYVTNGHKWFAAPRGVAVLAVATQDTRDSILRRPAVISHGVDDADFLSRFVWDGCRDYTAALSIPAVCEYWNTVQMGTTTATAPLSLHGCHNNDPTRGRHDENNADNQLVAIRRHCKETLRAGIQLMADRWHGGGSRVDAGDWPGRVTLADFDSPLLAPMALVRLPHLRRFLGRDNHSGQQTSTDAKKLQDFLYLQNIEVPVKCVLGNLHIRLSCHIYNRIEDYQHLAIEIDKLS